MSLPVGIRRWTTGLMAVSLGLLGGPAGWADEVAGRVALGGAAERTFCEQRLHGSLFARTELFFGLSRADGPDVSEEEFQRFVDAEVTPRFPDGLTLLSGDGQFRTASGVIVAEKSKLLILLYPFSNQKNRAIERIRTVYKRSFQQEAVLRVDEQSCVSF